MKYTECLKITWKHHFSTFQLPTCKCFYSFQTINRRFWDTNCDIIFALLWFSNKQFWNVQSYSQTFPKIAFIFPTKFFQRFRPNRVCFCMSRLRRGVCPSDVVNDDFTMQCWCNSERVHWFYLHVCARRTCNFIFQQSVRILSAMPNILCACNIFLLMN